MSRNQSAGQMNRILKMLVSGLKHLFLHNGWVKLLAVLISLVLWAGLISQDESITREKNFQNINVTVSGTDTMKRNGYIVTSNLDELLSREELGVRSRVRVALVLTHLDKWFASVSGCTTANELTSSCLEDRWAAGREKRF